MALFFFANKPDLKNHMGTHIEVGFSQYGPTLGLSGVLSAVKNVVFVENISLNLTRVKDKRQFLFDWFAFQPHQFKAKNIHQVNLKMPSKFTVMAKQPHKYNILFADNNTCSHLNPLFDKIKDRWQDELQAVKFEEVVDKYEESFEQFSKMDSVSHLLCKIKEQSCWEEGEYSATMLISTKNKKPLEFEKTFSLASAGIKTLEENIIVILFDLCKQAGVKYQFVSSRIT